MGGWMLKYIILMVIAGFLIGSLIKDRSGSIVAMFAVAIIWGISHKPVWGFAALGEMMLGYVLSILLNSSNNGNK
jgi:biotin transporter BioY